MARARFLRPEFFTDERVGSIPMAARLLFQASWCHADINGIVEWRAKQLRVLAFPHDEDVKSAQVDEWMQAIAAAGLVEPFSENGNNYAIIRNFHKHQSFTDSEIKGGPRYPVPAWFHSPFARNMAGHKRAPAGGSASCSATGSASCSATGSASCSATGGASCSATGSASDSATVVLPKVAPSDDTPTPTPAPTPAPAVVNIARARATESTTTKPPMGEDCYANDSQVCPPAKEVRRLTVGDLQAAFPVLLCHRAEDRDRAHTMMALYGWEAMSGALRALEPVAKARAEGKRRVLLSELAELLDQKYVLDPEDYRRAGLPVPEDSHASA